MALRWGTKTSFSIGPSVQYYRFDEDDNKGRFILNTAQLHSYDSASLLQDKWHAGVAMNFTNDTRDNDIMPTFGSVVNVKLQGFEGLNTVLKAFAQIIPSVSLYRSLNYKFHRQGCFLSANHNKL